MSQLNVYVPNELEKEIRRLAKRERQSLSRFLTEVLKNKIGQKKKWDKDFFTKVVGGWVGPFPKIEREIAEERDAW
ncbi:MAG: hypothetical protein HYU97_04610 [Deltaproteobacteria bacterium]|nr:hypothetical protein [Deltaproteobacteria bacterium]